MPSLVPRFLTDDVLRSWRLPMPDPEGDKEERGRVLIVAGSDEMPGAALLAGRAALRCGAGKLCVACPQSIAPALAIALPEARVVGLPATPGGGLAPEGVERLSALKGRADAVLVGPGLQDELASLEFVRRLLPLWREQPVVLDALAMGVVRQFGRFEQPVAFTPHAGEMAKLLDVPKASVQADAVRLASQSAQQWNAVVVLKGAVTWIAPPRSAPWRHDGGNVGLATSGSGDALAGAVVGLAARGAQLEQACAWGVALHAWAGQALARRIGPLGYLARELPDEFPALMRSLQA